MNDTNFQSLYYKIVEDELKRMLQLTNLKANDLEQVNEYISHNELGLAFEIIKNSPADASNSDEFEAQVNILSAFLS